MPISPSNLAERVMFLRVQRGESQSTLAGRVSVLGYPTNKDEIRRIEAGTKGDESVDPLLVLGIAQALDTTVTELSPRVAERLHEIEERLAQAQNWKMMRAS